MVGALSKELRQKRHDVRIILPKYKSIRGQEFGMKETGRVHIFRHTFATRLAARGNAPQDIMQALGHQDVATAMIYAHLMPESRTRAIRTLDQAAPDTGTADKATAT